MAKEWGRYNVTVNAVGFGIIETRLTQPLAGEAASIDVQGRKIAVGVQPKVLEWVKRDGRPLRRIPIVIVSSSDNPSDINRAYELGANAYMVKPMDYRAVEHLFQSITHYWGLECAKPELEVA